jgi:hypothetical protein
MKIALPITGAAILAAFAFSACSTQEEKPKAAPPPAPAAAPAAKAPAETAKAGAEKAKAQVEKAKGDVGLLDTDKNYMILVTKEGKLITLDFDAKTKVTKVTPTPSKMADVGLGSSATVTYTGANGKNVATALEYKVKKGGD